MTEDHIRRPAVVTSREHLAEVVAEVAGAPRLAVDTESNGFYAYRERVCLIQISTPDGDYIIDPIAVPDVSALGPLFENPSCEKVFHAGEYDILCLKRDYGFKFSNLFDTMIALRFLGFKMLGLAGALESHFGVHLSKKFQKADWGQRPLSLDQIRYAQKDTHYLLNLADKLKEKLIAKNRIEDAEESFRELEALEPCAKEFDPDGFWSIKGALALSGPSLAALKELYLFRETEARRLDRAQFRVMPDDLLLRLAREHPRTAGEIEKFRGVTPYLMRHFGAGILAVLDPSRLTEIPRPPSPVRDGERLRGKSLKAFTVLKSWRKAKAEIEGVDPAAILPGFQLEKAARLAGEGKPIVEALSPVKMRRYGEELSRLLKQ